MTDAELVRLSIKASVVMDAKLRTIRRLVTESFGTEALEAELKSALNWRDELSDKRNYTLTFGMATGVATLVRVTSDSWGTALIAFATTGFYAGQYLVAGLLFGNKSRIDDLRFKYERANFGEENFKSTAPFFKWSHLIDVNRTSPLTAQTNAAESSRPRSVLGQSGGPLWQTAEEIRSDVAGDVYALRDLACDIADLNNAMARRFPDLGLEELERPALNGTLQEVLSLQEVFRRNSQIGKNHLEDLPLDQQMRDVSALMIRASLTVARLKEIFEKTGSIALLDVPAQELAPEFRRQTMSALATVSRFVEELKDLSQSRSEFKLKPAVAQAVEAYERVSDEGSLADSFALFETITNDFASRLPSIDQPASKPPQRGFGLGD